jgi:hypothetical protein
MCISKLLPSVLIHKQPLRVSQQEPTNLDKVGGTPIRRPCLYSNLNQCNKFFHRSSNSQFEATGKISNSTFLTGTSLCPEILRESTLLFVHQHWTSLLDIRVAKTILVNPKIFLMVYAIKLVNQSFHRLYDHSSCKVSRQGCSVDCRTRKDSEYSAEQRRNEFI